MLSRKGVLNPEGKFDWKDALIDSSIMSALTFFLSIGGMSAVGLPSIPVIQGAIIAGATQFFLVLAMKRGLVKKK